MENWVVVSNIFYFHPYLGKWSNLTNIFQMGWSHQLEKIDGVPSGIFTGKFPGVPLGWCQISIGVEDVLRCVGGRAYTAGTPSPKKTGHDISVASVDGSEIPRPTTW